jgi:hypothetical protein
MSPAARALYPVLLRFSDRDFKPVYPGTKRLLELTGFRQKSTLRQARAELIELGLIASRPGSGRKNTLYLFCFDGVTGAPPRGIPEHPPAGGFPAPPGGDQGPPGYNQIHISINNNVQQPLAGAGSNHSRTERGADDEKILYRNGIHPDRSWIEIAKELSRKISKGSLKMIEQALLEEREGVLIFSDRLPDYLKTLLKDTCDSVFFEPDGRTDEVPIGRREFWKSVREEL